VLVAGPPGQSFQNHDEQPQSHSELWKQIVVGNRECEMQAVNGEGIQHKGLTCKGSGQ